MEFKLANQFPSAFMPLKTQEKICQEYKQQSIIPEIFWQYMQEMTMFWFVQL